MINRLSVKFKLFTTFALLIALAVWVELNFVALIENWQQSDNIEIEGQEISQFLAADFSSDVIDDDLEALQRTTDIAHKHFRDIASIRLYDREGKLLTEWRRSPMPDWSELRYFKSSIYRGNKNFGLVEIALDSGRIIGKGAEYSEYVKSFTIFILLLLGFLITLAVNLFIVSPIDRITNQLKETVDSEQDDNVDITVRDFQQLNQTVSLLKENIALRRDREKELQRAKLQLSSVLDTVGEAIITINSEGIVVMANKAAERVWGYDAEQLEGKNLSTMMPEEFREAHENGMKRYLQTGNAKVLNERMELVGQRANGSKFPIDIYIAETRIGEEVLFTAALRDITDRKQAEQELHDAKEKIEDILEERTRELKETQLQLIQAEKLETIGTLSAGVAHEVKNPLAIIQLGVDYLLKKSQSNDDLMEVIGEMDDAIQRADTVIKQLVDFSASRDMNLKSLNINTLVDDSLLLVKHELVKAKIEVKKDLGETLPEILGDNNKLEQVFINIFMNAIQAMDPVGNLSIKTSVKSADAVRLDVTGRFKYSNPAVVVVVEDDGPGINSEKLDAIFEPFFTTKPAGEGTGLGLTVVQNIIRLHKGSIRFENREQGGVRVTIIFESIGSDASD